MLQSLFAPRSGGGRRRSKGYVSHYVVTDGDAAYDTSAEVAAIVEANTINTAFTKIWQRTVPAQQVVRYGGGISLEQRNQGFMHFMAIDIATGFEDGILRLVAANARETKRVVVLEINTQRLHTVTATTIATGTPVGIDNLYPLPEQGPAMREDDRVILEFVTRVVTTIVDGADFSIPVTIYQ